LREYREILAGLPITLTSLSEQGITVDVPEDGETFAENAAFKARAYARLSGLLALADDSGLVVDALDGAPGVRSARFAGENASDADRVKLLLDLLQAVPSGRRHARFVCAIAIADPIGEVRYAEGTGEGCIAVSPRGTYGFGYDPVFFLPDFGRTMAELEPAEKNRISHRAVAGQAARAVLSEMLTGGEG
jgi:XTP/dITP diphosphohydrolase